MDAACRLQLGEAVGNIIPEGLFGQNLEITRTTMFGGMSAQLINNRRFYAAASESFARGWNPIGQCDMVFHGGKRTPVVSLSDEDAGVQQSYEGLWLRPGVNYKWRLRLSGVFCAEIKICLGKAEARVICSSQQEPVIVEGKLWSSQSDDGGNFSIIAVGKGEICLENVSLLPEDAVLCGLRLDVISQLRTMKPHSLRFPGGCYAEFYDWKQGLLDPDNRGVIAVEGMDFLLGPSLNQDPQDMNLDDFVQVCRMVGAQPHYTVRITDSTPEDAAALVEYANGGVETQWGAVRAARGFEKPHGIQRWYIGNEICWAVNSMKDPVIAAQQTVLLAKAMKRVDPSIELVPSNWVLCEWNQTFMSEIVRLGGMELFERASYHQYLLDIMRDYGDLLMVEKAIDPFSLEGVQDCLRAPVERILPRMRAVREELRVAGAGGLPVTMDEWNYYWGRTGHPVLALYMLGIFHVLIRHGAEMDIREAMYFHPINEGILRVEPDGVHLEDGAHAWQLARIHAGRRMIPLEDPLPEQPVDAAASAEGDTVYVTMVNRSLSKACRVSIPGFAGASVVRIECWRLERTEDCFRPGSMQLHPMTPDRAGELLLPAASMTAIWLEREVRE